MGDMAQLTTVTHTELLKIIRSKRFVISIAVVIAAYFLVVIVQSLSMGWDDIKNAYHYLALFEVIQDYMEVLIVGLIASSALVSEFEERTALILFTRPVKRTTVFFGKLIACVIIEAAVMLVYDLFVVGGCIASGFALPDGLPLSFALSVVYAFAMTCVMFLIGTIFKKSNTCLAMFLILMLVFVNIITSLTEGVQWYMLNVAGMSQKYCIPGVVDQYNMLISLINNALETGADVFDTIGTSKFQAALATLASMLGDPDLVLDPAYANALQLVTGFFGSLTRFDYMTVAATMRMALDSGILFEVEYANIPRDVGVMMAWALVSGSIALYRFKRKEF